MAGELLVEAARECKNATDDVHFAKSILLSGAVDLMVSPILDEHGIESLHVSLSKAAARFGGENLDKLTPEQLQKTVGKGIKYFRFTYNSLKHTGSSKVKASDDLDFFANLEQEAYHMIDACISDFNKLPLSQGYINTVFSDELLSLLQSHWRIPHEAPLP